MDSVSSPFTVVEGRPMYRLRRYFPGRPAEGPAVLLVPPLMMTAEVFDLDVEDGAVAMLHRAGIDPWVIDFGSPATEENGWSRTLDDHVLALSAAVDTVRAQAGREVALIGYCQGGMFCYLAAAHRAGAGIGSIVAIGSLVDWTAAGLPFGPRVANYLAEQVREGAQITDTILKTWWDLVDPVNAVRNRLRTVRARSAPAMSPAEERRRRFMAGEGRIGYPGPAASDLLRQFAIGNRLFSGGFVVGDRVHTMTGLICPILGVVGHRDLLAPHAAVRGIRRAARDAPVYELGVDAGHYKLVAGGTAVRTTWPAIAGFVHWQAGTGPRPAELTDMPEPTPPPAPRRSMSKRMLFAPPRSARPGRIGRATRISLGRAWSARATSRDCVLYAGRMQTETAVNARIDTLVRGLVALGVRPAERVGVVMGTHPGSLLATAALSRLGAVSVLLPADENLLPAMDLTGIDTVITGPADADRVGGKELRVLLLDGEHPRDDRRTAARDEWRLDAVDVANVRLPELYQPDPGTADESAYYTVAFDGPSPVVTSFTNRQWATRVYTVASGIGIDYRDTLYCSGALHDPEVFAAVGAALVSGARIALSHNAAPTAAEAAGYGAKFVVGDGHPAAAIAAPSARR